MFLTLESRHPIYNHAQGGRYLDFVWFSIEKLKLASYGNIVWSLYKSHLWWLWKRKKEIEIKSCYFLPLLHTHFFSFFYCNEQSHTRIFVLYPKLNQVQERLKHNLNIPININHVQQKLKHYLNISTNIKQYETALKHFMALWLHFMSDYDALISNGHSKCIWLDWTQP